MKILEVNKFFYPRRGAERHFIDLIRLLEGQGHEVAVFSMDHPENLPSPYEKFFPPYVGFNSDDSTFFQRLRGMTRVWSFGNQKKMESLLAEFCPDVVHIHNIYHQLSPSILAPIKKRGIPIVMTVHDYHLVSPDKDYSHEDLHGKWFRFLLDTHYAFPKRIALFLKFLIERQFRLYDRFVDAYVVPSAYLAGILDRSGISQKKIVILPHFSSSLSDKNISVEEYTLPQNMPKQNGYALCLGAVSEEKGVNDIARIFNRLEFPLIVAGAKEKNFHPLKSNFVSFVGKKSKSEVRVLIENAKLVISGSRLEETFGLVALEALSYGKPFFGMNVGAYPEIVRQGRDGFLGKNINDLEYGVRQYLSGELVMDVSEELKQRIKRDFSPTHYGNRILTLFESLIRRNRP